MVFCGANETEATVHARGAAAWLSGFWDSEFEVRGLAGFRAEALEC